MSEPGPFVVVGGSLAGLRALETARAAGYAGPTVLIGAEPHPPYDRPPRVIGALAMNEPGKIMKYRRLIQARGSWEATLALYAPR